MGKIAHEYIEPTPVVWRGLPDLRDRSKDLALWQDVSVSFWQVQFLCNASRQSVHRMVNDTRIYQRKAFGRPAILLGELSQTARCQYIEHLFRGEVSIANRLHRGQELADVLEVPKKSLLKLFRGGDILREYPPLLRPRYPHWGLPDSMQRAIEDWVNKQLNIKQMDKEARESWVRFDGFKRFEREL